MSIGLARGAFVDGSPRTVASKRCVSKGPGIGQHAGKIKLASQKKQKIYSDRSMFLDRIDFLYSNSVPFSQRDQFPRSRGAWNSAYKLPYVLLINNSLCFITVFEITLRKTGTHWSNNTSNNTAYPFYSLFNAVTVTVSNQTSAISRY